MTEQNYFVDTPWTWRERLRERLFPTFHVDTPEAPAHFKDCLVTTVTVRFGMADRLRVLLTGHIVVKTKTVCEHVVGENARSASVAYPSLKP